MPSAYVVGTGTGCLGYFGGLFWACVFAQYLHGSTPAPVSAVAGKHNHFAPYFAGYFASTIILRHNDVKLICHVKFFCLHFRDRINQFQNSESSYTTKILFDKDLL